MNYRTFIAVVALASVNFAAAAELDDSLEIILTAHKEVYSLQETVSFTVTTRNASSEPIEVLVRGFDWGDLARMDSTDSKLAAKIRAESRPRPLGKLEFSKVGEPDVKFPFNLDRDIGGCGTGLKKGVMPAGAETRAVYTVATRHMAALPKGARWPDLAASPGVYRFKWRAYRPQGKDRSRVDLSSAASNTVDIRLEE